MMFFIGTAALIYGAWRLWTFLQIPATQAVVRVNFRAGLDDMMFPTLQYQANVYGKNSKGRPLEQSGPERDTECEAINAAFSAYAASGGIVKPLDNWEKEGWIDDL